MKRRDVITGLFACGLSGVLPVSRQFYAPHLQQALVLASEEEYVDPLNDHENRVVVPRPSNVSSEQLSLKQPHATPLDEEQITQALDTKTNNTSVHKQQIAKVQATKQSFGKAAVNKSIHFATDYHDDIFVEEGDKFLLHSVASRLARLQKTVGYGNFNILSFDHAVAFGKRFPDVGEFTPDEKQFIEKMFSFNAQEYGFYGEKVTAQLTNSIKTSAVFKVPYTGHYLFKDQSLAYYEKIRNNIGAEIILTSGVRANVKQLHLFLAKVIRVNGNLSRASRSLAPPGYSYHGIGDFDVGRKGWGAKNFTDDFAKTDEFKRMQDLGYIAIRYDHGNDLGVRFEPWHVKVV